MKEQIKNKIYIRLLAILSIVFAFIIFGIGLFHENGLCVLPYFGAVMAAAGLMIFDTEGHSYISLIMSGISTLLSVIALFFIANVTISFAPLWSLPAFLLLLIITEIYFLLDSKKPVRKESKIKFTAKRKFVSLFYATLTLLGLNTGYQLVKDHWQAILKWVGYIGAGAIILAAIIGIIYLWLKLNSLKYGGKK